MKLQKLFIGLFLMTSFIACDKERDEFGGRPVEYYEMRVTVNVSNDRSANEWFDHEGQIVLTTRDGQAGSIIGKGLDGGLVHLSVRQGGAKLVMEDGLEITKLYCDQPYPLENNRWKYIYYFDAPVEYLGQYKATLYLRLIR